MKKLLGIVVLGLLLSGNVYAQKIRLICEGINTQNLILTIKDNDIVADNGIMKLELEIEHMGKNEIKATKHKLKGFFNSKLVASTTLTVSTISGMGKIETYSDYKDGLPNKYNFLSYKNCRSF